VIQAAALSTRPFAFYLQGGEHAFARASGLPYRFNMLKGFTDAF